MMTERENGLVSRVNSDGLIELRPEKVIGVMGIATTWNRQNYLVCRELMTKEWCDKQRGDLGTSMGGIEAGESDHEALTRELIQEFNLNPEAYVFSPQAVGYFRTQKGWVSVHVVMINTDKLSGRFLQPIDGETDSVGWIHFEERDRFGIRGGVQSVWEKFEQGKFFMDDTCQGDHALDNGRSPWGVIFDLNGYPTMFTWKGITNTLK